jgi:FtsH-binding integral membrane protein
MAFEPEHDHSAAWGSSPATDIDHANRTALAASFMNQVFGWMAAGLAVSGGVAWMVLGSPALYEFTARLFLPLMIAELVLVFALSAALHKLSSTAAAAGFLVYSALNGMTIGLVVSFYSPASVANVFFVTAGTFTAMAVIGTVTKKDLSGFGSFLMMGVIAILIASVVNFFLKSSALDFAVSALGALIFTGLTAVDAQRFRKLGYSGFSTQREASQWAIRGALNLYLDFINMFLFLLRLFGNRR